MNKINIILHDRTKNINTSGNNFPKETRQRIPNKIKNNFSIFVQNN